MTLRPPFRPLRPDLDRFLFATVGDEIDGIPLSVISALTRLGLDPWQESGRLSSLSNHEAVEQLARLIAELPGLFRPLDEARQIADHLIQLLPRHDTDRRSTRKSKFACVTSDRRCRGHRNSGWPVSCSREPSSSAHSVTVGFRSKLEAPERTQGPGLSLNEQIYRR